MEYVPYTIAGAIIFGLCGWALIVGVNYVDHKFFLRLNNESKKETLIFSSFTYFISFCGLVSTLIIRDESFIDFVAFLANIGLFVATLFTIYLVVEACKLRGKFK